MIPYKTFSIGVQCLVKNRVIKINIFYLKKSNFLNKNLENKKKIFIGLKKIILHLNLQKIKKSNQFFLITLIVFLNQQTKIKILKKIYQTHLQKLLFLKDFRMKKNLKKVLIKIKIKQEIKSILKIGSNKKKLNGKAVYSIIKIKIMLIKDLFQLNKNKIKIKIYNYKYNNN
jgi:hypothetical protein